jgi:crossover junction endodeoxyribonuclease RuvC
MNKIILGIDVGFAICGWSIIEIGFHFKNKMKLVDYGVIETSKNLSMPARLSIVFSDLNHIIDKYKPNVMAVEDIFFFKNQKTVIKVGEVRGVILLVGERNNLEIYEYTPLEVKTAVTGYGRAEKNQVQKMIQLIFSLNEIPKPDDAADAIAIAVCHSNNLKTKI